MAHLKPPKTDAEINRMGLSNLRKEYKELAATFMRIFDHKVSYCHAQDEFLSTADCFYTDKRFRSGLFPISRAVVLDMATDVDPKTGVRTDNKEKTQWVLHLMDLPYYDSIFESQLQDIAEGVGERNRTTAFQQYITMIKSLPQYRKKTWKDSEFGSEGDTTLVDEEPTRKARKEIKKIFGSGFSEADYLYLQDQYDDWTARTQVDTKSQETYIVQICFKQLEIWKAQKAGNDTDKMIKSLNDLMNAANLQPKQSINNTATDNLTYGQLLEKWEEEQPLPDPDPDFADVNKIGKYIRVWFAGGMASALGLKNAYSDEYEKEVEKYTVHRPEEIDGDETSSVYEDIFGSTKE